jgi:hypothetical protein
MRRREFIAGFAGAVAMPFVARAQRAAPVVGFLFCIPKVHWIVPRLFAALSNGLSLARTSRSNTVWRRPLRTVAGNGGGLVRRPVFVIAASGVTAAARQSRDIDNSDRFPTPAAILSGGLVSMARPEGNLTGVATSGKVSLESR